MPSELLFILFLHEVINARQVGISLARGISDVLGLDLLGVQRFLHLVGEVESIRFLYLVLVDAIQVRETARFLMKRIIFSFFQFLIFISIRRLVAYTVKGVPWLLAWRTQQGSFPYFFLPLEHFIFHQILGQTPICLIRLLHEQLLIRRDLERLMQQVPLLAFHPTLK